MTGLIYGYTLICLMCVVVSCYVFSRRSDKMVAENNKEKEKNNKEKDEIIVKLGAMLLAKSAYDWSEAFRQTISQPEGDNVSPVDLVSNMDTNDLVAAMMNQSPGAKKAWAEAQRGKK